ncbi:MAG: hypothetical protein OEV91_02880 [Desulfobulbaceae bacterium]|nr:hypothetical protein [Desulfobulbaceae bacterium]
MKADKKERITDALIGQDEKVCSCSVRIAELLRVADEKEAGQGALGRTLALLREKKPMAGKGEPPEE